MVNTHMACGIVGDELMLRLGDTAIIILEYQRVLQS